MKLPFQMLSKLNNVLRNGYVFCLNMYTCPLYLKQHTSVYYAVYFANEKMFTSTSSQGQGRAERVHFRCRNGAGGILLEKQRSELAVLSFELDRLKILPLPEQ